MNTQTFNTAIEDQIQRCKDTLIQKSDYGTDTDRLHNFQAYADLAGVTLEQACGGFLGKHIVSIYDLIREGAQGTASTRDIWDEKIGDAINYLLILSAIIRREDVAWNDTVSYANNQPVVHEVAVDTHSSVSPDARRSLLTATERLLEAVKSFDERRIRNDC